ncbi:MAG: type IV pilin protein [Caldimonas sp.]
MNPTPAPAAPHPKRHARGLRGFTLIETMVTIGIAGVLSSIAYPSLESQVMRARRTDALVALMQAQLAQERFRANNASYGSLADAGVRSSSPSGHYRIEVVSAGAAGYELLATAVARQARDASCRHLRLALVDATLTHASGNDTRTANPAAANRACWSRS